MSLFAILLFVGTMVLSLWATMRVRQVYGKFSQLPASSGLTGAETATTILRQEGISNVEIVEHDEALGDHYDPARKRLVLSRDNFRGTSAAALGVAAHECGHVIRHLGLYWSDLCVRRWRFPAALGFFAAMKIDFHRCLDRPNRSLCKATANWSLPWLRNALCCFTY